MMLLAEYEARMGNTIQSHSGSIDKYLGDGIMATFGAAPKSLIGAADALRAVDELIVVSKRGQKERRDSRLRPLEVGFAVATGPVIFGAVGDPNRLENTVFGDAVNLAAKLEKHNKVAGAVALPTSDAYREARAQGYEPPRERRELNEANIADVEQPVGLIVLVE